MIMSISHSVKPPTFLIICTKNFQGQLNSNCMFQLDNILVHALFLILTPELKVKKET